MSPHQTKASQPSKSFEKPEEAAVRRKRQLSSAAEEDESPDLNDEDEDREELDESVQRMSP
jgi:hypothetical protein